MCVHTEHCCAEEGCKYGEDDCPVWLGYKKQSYGYFDGSVVHPIPQISEEEYKLRRDQQFYRSCRERVYTRYDQRET